MTYITGKPAGTQTSGDGEYTLAVNQDGSINAATSTAGVGVTYAAASQVSVTGTAGTLLAAGSFEVVIFRALQSNTQNVFWGPATVTATTGMLLAPGEEQILDGTSVPVNLIQAISQSGTQTVIVMTAA